jgi:GNAT superfamily N-acetyltransferase
MHVRATTVDDLPALYEVFLDSIGGVYRSHGFEPPAPSLEIFINQQRHILETGGAAVVAEQADRPLGFATAWTRGNDWFLASLFVDPGAQAGGVGTALLDAVWGPEVACRRTITDAIQPVSNALYGRRGLIPATPILTFEGPVARTVGSSLEPSELDADGLASIDAAAYGFNRALDHRFWSRVAHRCGWLRDGMPAAYAYVLPGHVGPVAGVDPDAAAEAIQAALAETTASVRIQIPGTCRSLVAAALAAGLRLGPTPMLLLLSEGAEPPNALAIAGATMF